MLRWGRVAPGKGPELGIVHAYSTTYEWHRYHLAGRFSLVRSRKAFICL